MARSTSLQNQFYETVKNLPTDGLSDCAPIINAALTTLGNKLAAAQSQGLAGPSCLVIPGGTYTIKSTLNVPTGITLKGETFAPPYPNRISGFRSNQNMLTGTELKCSVDFVGENAVLLAADNTNLENVILDGHSIPCGTTWTQVNITSAQGKWVSTSGIKFPIHDSLDIRVFSLKIDNIEIPYFKVGDFMEFHLQALGGDGTYTWSILSGSLPPGLSLSSDGLISGTATEYGDSYFPLFQVVDGTTASVSRTIRMGTIIDEIKTREVLPPTAEASYSFTLETWYEESGLTWALVKAPSWLSINSSTGELTAPNTTTNDDVDFFDFKVQLLSGTNVLETRVFNSELRYSDGAIQIFGEQRLKPQQNLAFSYKYKASGGYGSYTWSINSTRSNNVIGNATTTTSTSPYVGLTLNATTGEITGTATTLGTNTYYLRATSTINTSIFYESLFYIEVVQQGQTPRIYTRSLKTATKGQFYSYQFNVEDIPSAKPYTYEAVNLPTGLTMNSSTGLITGTPTGATFTNGVRIQWSDNVKNCTIRGFRSGGGIYTKNPSNLHRIEGCLISVCDVGLQSVNQTYDSHITDMYIYNCRIGIELGPGSAGLTFTASRVEFIHEHGIKMQTANENDFSSIYFDTCGWNSINILESRNTLIGGCRFLRSGRLIRGVGTKFDPKCNVDYSAHIGIVDSPRISITGNIFDLGSKDGADGLFLTDHFADNVRPYVVARLYNTKEISIVGNSMTGSANETFSADLTNFGENTYKGYRISDNVKTDRHLTPIGKDLDNQYIYIPNQCFQVWQRDNAFSIPASFNTNASDFPIADYWTLSRGGNTVINQSISVSRKTGGPYSYYLNLTKPLNTTAVPGDNYQKLELNNQHALKLSYTSNRNIILSFYAKSINNNKIKVKVSQYTGSPSFKAFQKTSNNINLTSQWKRYQIELSLSDLTGITLGSDSFFNLIFQFNEWNQNYNVDITGVQVDFVDQTPFAQSLREGSFEDELKYAKLRYQKSKDYTQYFASWADGYRYDVNGANWQPGYTTIYSTSTTAAALSATIGFDVPFLNHPGNPDTLNGVLPNFKVLNPQEITNRTSASKYSFNGTNTPSSYIQVASKSSITATARNSASAPAIATAYSFHWVYTLYAADILVGGGGYA